MVEVEKLVNITVEIILKNSISDLQNVKPTRVDDISNIWNRICLKYFGNIRYQDALKIFTWWTRDTKNYSSLTRMAIEELKETKKMEIDSIKKDIIVPLNSNEWKSISCLKATYNKRSKFISDFSNFLSEKIQKHGINCWLKCDFNWFKKNESQKLSSPFWKGRYQCYSCKNTFFTKIIEELKDPNENTYVIIFVTYYEYFKHDAKISPKIRCFGEKRLEQAKELMYESTSNVITNNIIDNAFSKSVLGITSKN